jgi:hypothetical protein
MNPVPPFPDLVRNSVVPSKSSIEGGAGTVGEFGGPSSSSSSSWRWTIPDAVDGSGGRGLSDVAVDTLHKCLQPVLDGLGALDAEVLLELHRSPPGADGEKGGPRVRDG